MLEERVNKLELQVSRLKGLCKSMYIQLWNVAHSEPPEDCRGPTGCSSREYRNWRDSLNEFEQKLDKLIDDLDKE